ncbi:hypothetical protein Bca4012_034357 [Brassica carinata]
MCYGLCLLRAKGKCVSDHLWEKHMEKKWGRLMGAAAIQEWKSHVSTLMGRPSCGKRRRSSSSSPVAIDSVMYWYSNLESGKFWFCAQVKQRNPLYVGLGISYYDAKVRYDSKTDTFQASHVFYTCPTVCKDSYPETVSRSNGEKTKSSLMVGGLATWVTCDTATEDITALASLTVTFDAETVVLEFRPFKRGSTPWGTMVVNRKIYRESGNEARGFYGGVRKLGRIRDFIPGDDS